MLLGDVIARFSDEAVVDAALLSLGDFALTARLVAAAERHRLTTGELAAELVAQFVNGASDEDWLGLIGEMALAHDPGQVFLRRALGNAIAEQGKVSPARRQTPGPQSHSPANAQISLRFRSVTGSSCVTRFCRSGERELASGRPSCTTRLLQKAVGDCCKLNGPADSARGVLSPSLSATWRNQVPRQIRPSRDLG